MFRKAQVAQEQDSATKGQKEKNPAISATAVTRPGATGGHGPKVGTILLLS